MIYITGDTHGTYDFANLLAFPGREKLTKNDYVIIAGDFGGVWYGGSIDEDTQNLYESMPFTVLFVDGNHENFDLLNAYPTEEWHGGKIHRIGWMEASNSSITSVPPFSIALITRGNSLIGIDVGIAVSRLQKEGKIKYNRHNDLKTKYELTAQK